MTDLKSDRYNNIYKLLSEHNFAVNRHVPSDLLCVKCKHILIDACKISCGCCYCRKCIDDLVTNNRQVCLGNTEFCKDKPLLDIQIDYLKNKKIMKLVVKCPEELCPHECELINMDEHLSMCSNKCITDLFYGFECEPDKLGTNKICDFPQSKEYYQNNVLIVEMKNELDLLKKKDEINKIEIQNIKDEMQTLKAYFSMKDEKITELQNEISSIKQMQNQQMTQQVKVLKEQSEGQITQEGGMYHTDQIQSIKMETRELARQMKILERNVDNKIVEKCAQEKQECRENLERELKMINEGVQKFPTIKKTRLTEKWRDQQVEGVFSWRVDQISDKRHKDTNIFSEIFYPKLNPYKMQLQLVNCADGDKLFIYLYIHPGENDERLKWPYQGNLVIKITNKAHPNVSKTITQYCNIHKTDINSYKCSSPFRFSYKELSSCGLTQNNYFIVECRVE